MNTCRTWLSATLSTADRATRRDFAGAAVLGDRWIGYTIELRDAQQIYVGRTCCKYCARAKAIDALFARNEQVTE